MKSLLSSRQRAAMNSNGERCGAQDQVSILNCMLPKGHRGSHAGEIHAEGGRICGIWPSEARAKAVVAAAGRKA